MFFGTFPPRGSLYCPANYTNAILAARSLSLLCVHFPAWSTRSSALGYFFRFLRTPWSLSVTFRPQVPAGRLFHGQRGYGGWRGLRRPWWNRDVREGRTADDRQQLRTFVSRRVYCRMASTRAYQSLRAVPRGGNYSLLDASARIARRNLDGLTVGTCRAGLRLIFVLVLDGDMNNFFA